MNTAKYLRYECRRNLLPLLLFTAIACLVVGIIFSTSTLYYNWPYIVPDGNGSPQMHRPSDSLLAAPAVILVALCVIVTVMQFSFRMKARSTDLWYSLPVRREKLLFVRTLTGLALVFIPYTLSYWLGFCILLGRENYFFMQGYPLYFLASLPLGALLFGFCSFIFTRANSVGDGIVFMISWTFVLFLPHLYVNFLGVSLRPLNITSFLPFGPLIFVTETFSELICRTDTLPSLLPLACLIPFAVAEGVGGYAGLFLTARRQRAENAEQLSSSLWGYKTLIPWFVFFFSSCIIPDDGQLPLILWALVLIGGLVGYIVYRRSFRLKLADILSLVLTFAASVLLSYLNTYFIIPAL